jgi:hypothetical protein
VSLAEIIRFPRRKPDPLGADLEAATELACPVELDPDFEQQCHQFLQEPVPTPLESLRAGMVKVLAMLRDQDKAHDDRIADLSGQLADEGKAKAANLGEIARIERALEQLSDEPVPAPAKSKRGKQSINAMIAAE